MRSQVSQTQAQLPSLLSPHAEGILEAHCLALPESARESLLDYFRYGLPPGHFLTAVLSNDLTAAIGRGDELHVRLLPVYVSILVNAAPADAWGSIERVGAWIQAGALMRRNARTVA